jgi:hypothetical protein
MYGFPEDLIRIKMLMLVWNHLIVKHKDRIVIIIIISVEF